MRTSWNFSPPSLPRLLRWCREKGGAHALEACAIAAVAWIIAQGFWWLAAPSTTGMDVKALPTLSLQSQRTVARHFFGAVSTSQLADVPGESPPPQSTDTRWRLIGTYVSSDARSRAVLALGDGTDVVVAQMGDQLSTGHKVVDVRPDGAVLSKGSQQSELALRPSSPRPEIPPDQRASPLPQETLPPRMQAPFTKDSR